MLKELAFGINIYELVGYPIVAYGIWVLFDILSGLLRAGKDRKINSSINFDGLIRKFGGLIVIVFLTFIDFYLGTDGIITKTGVYALIIYESISIIENFKQIGINIDFVMKYLDDEKYKGGKK